MQKRLAKKKMMFLVIFVAALSATCHAQDDLKGDSLLKVLKSQKDDTGKVNTLNALSKLFLLAKNLPDAKKYAEDALSLAEKKGFKKGITNANVCFGNIYNHQGNSYYNEENYSEALKSYLSALKLYEKNEAKKGIAHTRRNIGRVYWIQTNYSEALKNFKISLSSFEEIEDKNAIAVVYNDIGVVYENQGDTAEALKNYFAALRIFDETGDKESMMNRLFNIGFLYDNRGNYSEALKNFSAALKISEEMGSKDGIAACNNNIADTYFHQGQAESNPKQKEQKFNEALNSYSNSLKGYKELGDKQGIAICYNGIGGVFIELKYFSRARQFLNDGLSLFKKMAAIEYPDESYQPQTAYIRDNYQLLARLDSATNNWEGAFRYYKSYLLYRDSLVNEESTQRIMRAQMQYEFDKKEDLLKYQQALTDEKLKQQSLSTRQQKLMKNYLLAGFVLFAILSFLVYKNYRARQQLKLQTLRNKIASDLHDDVGSTLSSISIFSQIAQQQSKEVIPLLETIQESSYKMLDAMADIVWTIKPENDQFEKIISRMKSFAYELLGAKKIDFEFVADDDVAKMKLPMEVRKNLYLIFKEATNNMVKYAGANKAMFAIKGDKNNMTMLIQDNGKGFDVSKSTQGNGLKNMKKRATEIKAQLTIRSFPGSGTTIQLSVAV